VFPPGEPFNITYGLLRRPSHCAPLHLSLGSLSSKDSPREDGEVIIINRETANDDSAGRLARHWLSRVIQA